MSGIFDEFDTVRDAIGNGTFDPQGANATYAFDTGSALPDVPTPVMVPSQNSTTSDLGLPSLPSLPPVGGSATSASGSTATAANAAGITGGSVPPASTTGNPTATGAQANNWFVRGVIVVLGFVFVAVGLSQFGVIQRMRA